MTEIGAMRHLAKIPLIDIGAGGPVALAEARLEQAKELIGLGGQLLPGPLLPILNALSRRWARDCTLPYLDEIAALDEKLPRGVWFMNFCYEWGCTTGVAPDPAGTGMQLLRTLDWPFHGLERHVVVSHQTAVAGDYYNITWPGFVGVVTAMAPGRFALAINQAPMIRRALTPMPIDWILNRLKVARSHAIPPSFLARHIMDTCKTYAEAKTLLESTPLALPVAFILAGNEEGCVIERMENQAWVHGAPAAFANHWITEEMKGDARGIESHRRLHLMHGICSHPEPNFDWLIEPILNEETRLAVAANAAIGSLLVQGFEKDGPATEIFNLARP
jgi:hypothetical protein